MPAYRVGGIYSRMPDTVRARAKKRIGSLIRDLAHFVPHSGHTYAVASRTSSKFTAREHAVATDPATVQAAPLGSAHLLSPLSFSLSLYACATFLAREEGERERGCTQMLHSICRHNTRFFFEDEEAFSIHIPFRFHIVVEPSF